MNSISLDWRDLYAFVINNEDKLRYDIIDAMADESLYEQMQMNRTTEKPIGFPPEFEFTYDRSAKKQVVMSKNVYRDYLSSAEPRSTSERLFERYCEDRDTIAWIYKNGDRGLEFFSIVYEDNFGKQKSFYPDYIVGTTDGKVWVIETKGGFTRSGQSEDIDKYTAKKFGVLKSYLEKYGKQGGIVRLNKHDMQLCICIDSYSEDIKSASWRLLEDVL